MTSVPGAGALPYVMFHPFYWSNAPEQNIYCANQWSGQESAEVASRAADDAAKLRAERTVEVLLVQARAGVLTRDGDVTDTVCPNGGCLHDADRLRSLAVTALNANTDAGKNAKAALVELVQRHTLDWTSGISAKCKARNLFGLWVGYPLKFTATVPYQLGMGETRRGRLDITPLVAFGYGMSPNAYVSILAGFALGKTNLPPGGDDDDELVVSFVLGLGGNLDLLGLFTK